MRPLALDLAKGVLNKQITIETPIHFFCDNKQFNVSMFTQRLRHERDVTQGHFFVNSELSGRRTNI